ncbi:decaprenyl-phosphate phosphoribosyltransferase [Paraperlucidibaca wandonensis]|jgi:4-hydroxybenzoate polyprenyltransferase|uniref:Decaprenyl-phosphate phosphoribosyltransferase n=1 Tax=Paraperlucidibaca wandonensis TaxID=1268273 RepID=A0ABW3HDG8_9GAMM|nr:decaprenyl-phosphate phosphoribosyltransferase [Paraperlucidibaca sp.]MBQ0721970.1 decaprenyl-phosphate phosphoribosyltransferase [Paraperlucidibaca sp.]MBQ0841679.1 decaprenyl-phosphate phosphoribosyltransferase [Paraperlucidibaca sp.]|tara:strand:- start:2140 stop:3003 length:864 start_codon:yes stop_codon:yes gene_type:complete
MTLIKLMRPHQWVKNGFVLTGLVFGHGWDVPEQVQAVLLAFIAFCLASSCVYVFNDLSDAENDRLHPTKRNRPIASGAVTARQALLLAAVLGVVSLSIAWSANPPVAGYIAAYLVLNMAYTWRLKRVVLLDIFCISAGFMLRILAGTDGVDIPPSNWLLFCGLWTTLFLGFIKRRAEMIALDEGAGGHRKVLEHYSATLLDQLISITCMGMIFSYSLYTMDVDVRRIHNTDQLIYTVPFVIYACFRYLYLLHRETGGGDPSRDLIRDPHIVAAGLSWLLMTLVLVAR